MSTIANVNGLRGSISNITLTEKRTNDVKITLYIVKIFFVTIFTVNECFLYAIYIENINTIQIVHKRRQYWWQVCLENEGVVFFFFCINRSIFNRILPYTDCLGNVCYTHFIVHIHRYILHNDIFASQL